MTNIGFPFRIDRHGRTARVDRAQHIRDLIEQLLFTSPGERVNRPTLGSGLAQLVFAPLSSELLSATQGLVQGNLQEWLADRIRVDAVEVAAGDGRLEVTVRFTDLQSELAEEVRVTRELT